MNGSLPSPTTRPRIKTATFFALRAKRQLRSDGELAVRTERVTRALRVAVITPPLDASGGIGRITSYVRDSVPNEVALHIIDTRGYSRRAVFSLGPLVRAWCRLVAMILAGRVDVAHINISRKGSTARKSIMFWTCRLLRTPVVLHLHASSYADFVESLPNLGRRLVRATFRTADRVVVLGDVWHTYLRDELGVAESRIQVLLNAVPGPDKVSLRRRSHDTPFRVLFLGRLGARKGVAQLLTALADSRLQSYEWEAVLAGDGDVQGHTIRAEQLGLQSRVAFTGWVDGQAVTSMLSEAHVLILPSRAEGLPLSVIEAFAHGVPVIATPVGAVAEVVVDGVNGLLIARTDPGALANAIVRLLRDETLRLELANQARSSWERSHRLRPYTRELVRIWQTVADEKAARS